ncbi:pilus assembly protein TadG-related protein [Streptomyces sp. NPDC058045]|uniref:pilus assembly protein TadG-related protein n=1 Tax=Streptomyces sp. NPDC058045 TaxID=3346311 RepID=UPI0036E7724A
MRLRQHGDSGQAFPIYITVVAGLLFLAFAYLAVGQAAATKNGAQTAADSAALAAAQDQRDQLAGVWLKNILDPSLWESILDGTTTGLNPSCWRAQQFAARNGAHLDNGYCDKGWWPLSYTVKVKTDKPVGESIVPGTEHKYATATARAVIEPRCSFNPLPDNGNGKGKGNGGGNGKGKDKTPLPELICKGKHWNLDPDHLVNLPGPEDLFDVHLAD